MLLFAFLISATMPSDTDNENAQPTLEFHAEKTKSKDIHKLLNKFAPEGWMPAFILDDQLRKRVIFRRSIDPSRRALTLEYHARTVGGMMKELQDVVNEEAAEGWMPIFIIRDTFRHRIIFTRNKSGQNADAEYMKLVVDNPRHLDEAFNHHGSMGWEPKFVVEYGERYHALLQRKKDAEVVARKYTATKTFGTSLIDNEFNEMGASGWQPIYTFVDRGDYRMVFGEHPNAHRVEYFSERVTHLKHLDDAFRRRNQNGWFPVFVYQFSEDTTLFTGEEQFRLLYARAKS